MLTQPDARGDFVGMPLTSQPQLLPALKLEARPLPLGGTLPLAGWVKTDTVYSLRETKVIKTIGKLEAAIYIERESGYSALWIAKGIGPKRVKPVLPLAASAPYFAAEPLLPFGAREVVRGMDALLGRVPNTSREGIADLMAGWARAGGGAARAEQLIALFSLAENQAA